MDAGSAKYLEDNIGGVLAKALAEMSVVQPKDGVDFLAKWLKTYAEQEEAKAVREQEEKDLATQREQTRAEMQEKEEKAQQKMEAAQKLEALYTGLLDKFSNAETKFQDSMWQELVDVAQATAGASAVYLGIAEPGEEGGDPGGPYISYEYASKGSEWMVEKTLPQGTGMTWGALTENPPDENFKEMCLWKPPSVEPVPAEPVDGEEPPPEKPGNPYYPVCVECVTDVKGVHYFDMTRLGAYLAIPLVYPSYYTSDAYADAKTFEEEKKAEAKRRAEEEAARIAAVEAGEAPAEDAPAEPAEPVEEKQMVLRGNDVKMVLCLDTLGTNTSIEEAKAIKVLELVKACGQCKSQTEFKQVDDQVLSAIDDDLRAQQGEQITEATTNAQTSTQEALDAEDAEAPEERKDVIQKKFAFLRAVQVAKDMADAIATLKSWVFVGPEVLSVVAAAAFLAGYTKEQIYPRRKTALDWQKLKTFLENPLDLLEKIAKVEFEGARKGLSPEQKNAYILQMASPAELGEEKAEKAREIAPAFLLIFNVIQAACAYRSADLEMRKAEWTKQKEEAGEEYAGPSLEELDDDFEGAA